MARRKSVTTAAGSLLGIREVELEHRPVSAKRGGAKKGDETVVLRYSVDSRGRRISRGSVEVRRDESGKSGKGKKR